MLSYLFRYFLVFVANAVEYWKRLTLPHLVSLKGNKYLNKPAAEGVKGLTLSWRRPLSYSNYLLRKSMDWFLYDNGLRQEMIKSKGSLILTELTRIVNQVF